jgi:hypothetical protein
MTYEEKRAADFAADLAKPFLQRQEWRKDHMYRGWMLEPVIDTFGDRIAITRSNYGYRVLNTPDLGMVDVDFNLDFDTAPQQMEVSSNLRDWVAKHPGQSWKVYRTAAGLRLLRTDAPQPLDQSYSEVVSAVWGADTLYAKLCVEQQAFRARVSPKPKRIGIAYPDWNPYDEGSDGWSQSDPERTKVPLTIQAYEILQTQYKTCELVEVIGSGDVHNHLGYVLHLHDTFCKVNSNLPLEPLAEKEDRTYHHPTDMQVLAFSEVYRIGGITPDLMWNTFPPSFRCDIKCSPDKEWVMEEWDKQAALAKKAGSPIVSAQTKLEQLKATAHFYDHQPAVGCEPCPCDECAKNREFAKTHAFDQQSGDADEDWFAALVKSGSK